ncbi:preprotein translocase subunit SecG [Candidatus Nomurabacteria bacterium]|nr:preprotein translocase subunit SecG [Candidatus Nomurabacteria bacterium]
MVTILSVIQIVISVILVIAILLQSQAAGLGGAFGGSDGDSSFHTRRGFEKILFRGTIVLGVLFAIVSFLIFYLS